jgi:hypothetical protein
MNYHNPRRIRKTQIFTFLFGVYLFHVVRVMNLEFCFPAFDRRVNGISVILQKTMSDYNELAHKIKANPFQRKPLRKGLKTIEFLRNDLKRLCLMPPIVLSTTSKFTEQNSRITDALLQKQKFEKADFPTLVDLVEKAIDSHEIIILDGLQRTFAIDDVLSDATRSRDDISNHPIRLELYLGLNRAAILYRMLTLNTGQTRMTVRHQLEIVYRDYLEGLKTPEGISIVKDVDKVSAKPIDTYRFSNVIELFIACIHNNPAPLGKETVFDRIKSMDFLQNYGTKIDALMMELLEYYHQLAITIDRKGQNWKLDEEKRFPRTFGATVSEIFGKSQSMTGFGSACRLIVPEGRNFEVIIKAIQQFNQSKKEVREGLYILLEILNDITERGYRTKIGPLQRRYFESFYDHLLSKRSDSFLDIKKSADLAFKQFLKKKGGVS